MLYQTNLFDTYVMVERTLASGSQVRLLLEPVGTGEVRILEYHRKAARQERFKRLPQEEGKVRAYSSLNLSLSFKALFGGL